MVASFTRRRFIAGASRTLLAGSLGTTLLSACGGNGSNSSGPVTITYGWWSNSPTKDNAMLAWIKAFEKSHPKIKVKPEILSWSNYWTKVQTTIAGGNAYDIIGMAGGNAAPYYAQEALLDLNTFSDYKQVAQGLIPSTVGLCNWNGKQYGLPVGVYIPLVMYNKTLLSKAGIPNPDPTTPMELSDFMKLAPKLSLKSNGKYTQYAVNLADFDGYWNTLALMEGGQAFDKQVNPKKVLINSPAGIKGLTNYQNLYIQNAAVPYATQSTGAFGQGGIDSILTDKVAFARSGAFDFSQIVGQKLQDKVGLMPQFSINGKQVTLGNANSFGIFSGSKNPEAAWEFIKWATSTDGDTAFAKLSDVPSNSAAFNNMSTFINPSIYVPTLNSAQKGFQPLVMTPSQQFPTDLTDILTDLASGKTTPEKAASLIEKKGNADLTANS